MKNNDLALPDGPGSREPSPAVSALRASIPSAEVLAPRNCDEDVAQIMDELSKLQTLLTLQMRQGPVWIAAADLVQRTRCLIVERCYTGTPEALVRRGGK